MIPFAIGIFALLVAFFISLDVWVALSTFSRTTFTRVVLFTNALWLAINIAFLVVRYRQLIRKAKDITNPVPKFSLFRQPRWSNLPGSALTFIWSIVGTVALVRYLETLPGDGLQAFKAAGITFIVIAIIGYMVLQSVFNATGAQYFGLERDIVLNRMTPAEIRERYLRDLSGPDMIQWLDDSFVTLKQKEQHLWQELESAKAKVKEIAAINPEYPAERKQRAGVALADLRKSLADCLSQYEVLAFQGGFFVDYLQDCQRKSSFQESESRS